MLTVIYVSLLLLLVLLPVPFLFLFDKQQKRRIKKQLLQQFHQAGQEAQLTFSRQEILRDQLFGLDGTHRRMLLVEKVADGYFNTTVIDLNDVQRCFVKKECKEVQQKTAEGKNVRPVPERIALCFLSAGKVPVEILFYEHQADSLQQVSVLEEKALRWEAILSKMLLPLKKFA